MERGDKIQRNSSRAIKHKCLKLMAFDSVKNAAIFLMIMISKSDSIISILTENLPNQFISLNYLRTYIYIMHSEIETHLK